MNPIKQKLISAKNAVQEHQTQILTTALVLTTSATVLMRLGHVHKDNFLKEKGLYDEYYSQPEEV
jgi:hypothetical protein